MGNVDQFRGYGHGQGWGSGESHTHFPGSGFGKASFKGKSMMEWLFVDDYNRGKSSGGRNGHGKGQGAGSSAGHGFGNNRDNILR